MKLHLGCGTVYLPGYVNIDYPPGEQTSPHASEAKADKYADIVGLHYEPQTVHEVRLHHVFEHFTRPTALRLLVQWYDWLCEDGILTIETPDFDRCMKAYLLGNTKTKAKVLRCLFGSHDAKWAVHCDGWSKDRFKGHLLALGYRNLKFEASHWRGMHSITVRAQKQSPYTSLAERRQAAERLLRLSLVDDSDTEERVLSSWLKSFNASGDETD